MDAQQSSDKSEFTVAYSGTSLIRAVNTGVRQLAPVNASAHARLIWQNEPTDALRASSGTSRAWRVGRGERQCAPVSASERQ